MCPGDGYLFSSVSVSCTVHMNPHEGSSWFLKMWSLWQLPDNGAPAVNEPCDAPALARVHAAESPVLTAGPLRRRAGGPPAPLPASPAASALSSDRLCPGSHAHWLWISLFLADHLPAFPGLSGIPSNSKHFLSSAGLRSESLTVARSCQQSWPGEGLRPCPWSLVCLPPPRQPLRVSL